VDFDRVLKYYQQAHVLVLASQTEGWPKAIAEAMAFGLVCIGSQRGMVPEMLGEQRGLLVPPGDVDALTAALQQIAATPQEYSAMSARAAQWGQRYSLEELRDAIRDLLSVWWGLPVCCRDGSPPRKEPCTA
jgi:glycosyltransferase involved in cell wall biosynthesis